MTDDREADLLSWLGEDERTVPAGGEARLGAEGVGGGATGGRPPQGGEGGGGGPGEVGGAGVGEEPAGGRQGGVSAGGVRGRR